MKGKGLVTRAFGNRFRRIDSLYTKVLTNLDRFDGLLMDSMRATKDLWLCIKNNYTTLYLLTLYEIVQYNSRRSISLPAVQ